MDCKYYFSNIFFNGIVYKVLAENFKLVLKSTCSIGTLPYRTYQSKKLAQHIFETQSPLTILNPKWVKSKKKEV